jgi:diguanylate cyclase (GGDEF)-like protein
MHHTEPVSPSTDVSPASAAAPTYQPSILLVDDDDDILAALGELLGGRYRLTFARNGEEAVAALGVQTFDLSILDLSLPVVDGFALVGAIQRSRELAAAAMPSAAIMLLSAHAAPDLKVRALALGAVDYMTKPFDSDELLARVARILAGVAREAGLRAEAMTDALTGLANARSFSRNLERELDRSRRHQLPLSLLTIDLDHLKVVNDQHGHDAGDDAIRMAARVLASVVRKFEIVARQGGDEFAIILPNTDCAEAQLLAERLCGELRALIVRGTRLSSSIGVACLSDRCADAPSLIKASDEAMYRAKRAGRDRVEVGGSDESLEVRE